MRHFAHFSRFDNGCGGGIAKNKMTVTITKIQLCGCDFRRRRHAYSGHLRRKCPRHSSGSQLLPRDRSANNLRNQCEFGSGYDLLFGNDHVTNIDASREASEDFLRGVRTTPDLIIADPPRSGLGKEATQELLRIKPKKLTIVSCDPATLARDLKVLMAAFEVKRMTLVDLFPQTYHFECVFQLSL